MLGKFIRLNARLIFWMHGVRIPDSVNYAPLAQLVRAASLHGEGPRFES